MAIDKDPSIYRDRGTIGSSDELDEYGVWVKSEPQDIASSGGGSGAAIEPSLPDIEDLPDLELDGDSDFGLPSMEDIALDEVEAVSEGTGKEGFEDSMDFSVEELVPGEAQDSSFEEVASFDADGDAAPSSDEFTELSMDDFLDGTELSGGPAEKEAGSLDEEPLDIDLDFAESVDLADEAGTEALSFESGEASDDEGALKLETVSDFDDFLNDMSSGDGAESSDGAEAALPDLNEEEDIALSLSGGAKEEHFDDVEALHRELEESVDRTADRAERAAAPVLQAAATQGPDLSTQLLMRIADELASIKNELSSLKGELAVLKSDARTEAAAESQDQDAAKGFFDEEDDEKIALTGDELDNILNTADFTEEAGADAVVEEEEEFGIGSIDSDDFVAEEGEPETESQSPDALDDTAFLSDQDDILGAEESGEITVDEVLEADDGGIERIEVEGDAESASVLPEELVRLREDGVRPMTEAPEDTSYLEDEPLDLEHLDLTEAVIEEPDLGAFVLEEAPVQEPSIESIHIDLDLEEELHVEDTSEAEDETETYEEDLSRMMELPVEDSVLEIGPVNAEEVAAFEAEAAEEAPALEESFEEVIPEDFVVGPDETQLAEDFQPEEFADTVELADAAEADQGETLPQEETPVPSAEELPSNLKQEVKTVLSYMDQLLESLPEDKIEEFARSEYFETYKKLFEELGLV